MIRFNHGSVSIVARCCSHDRCASKSIVALLFQSKCSLWISLWTRIQSSVEEGESINWLPTIGFINHFKMWNFLSTIYKKMAKFLLNCRHTAVYRFGKYFIYNWRSKYSKIISIQLIDKCARRSFVCVAST